jgi:superfamily II DNA or RNA helicase
VKSSSIEAARGKDLFIVDNSISGWNGIRYLAEWCDLSRSFDIATGYFEIGALLALDGKWQQLDKIRILMGADTTYRTKKAILEAVRAQTVAMLNASLETNKEGNPFLSGVPAVLEALRNGKIECRVYDKDKFHAKAYITHARMEIIGSQALVGSSNFTEPGLTRNIELNVQIQSAREVAQLQEWFESHWDVAREVTDVVIETIDRHIREYSPYEVYGKALLELFKGHQLTATEWDETHSVIFPKLDRYQKEAYWALMNIAQQFGGAFLCDGVGLGKTFVGLMIIERMIYEGKRVLLFAPKSAKESVWEPILRSMLPEIGGGDLSSLAVFSHTDLMREGDFPERFKRVAQMADVVLIDEAHHFRNPGRGILAAKDKPTRYYKLYDLLDPTIRTKTVYMLTATPINNRLSDIRHMAELFTRRNEAVFGKTLGINNLKSHFSKMEKDLRKRLNQETLDVSDHIEEAREVLASDAFFTNLVVQRSRSYARESQIREGGKAAMFPTRHDPQVAGYSIKKTYGKMLEMFDKAFKKDKPLFSLPMYYPLAWYIGEDGEVDAFEENRQKQVIGLIRTSFLKRFESSIAAFELSCERMLLKLLAFVEVHSVTEAEKRRLSRWKERHSEILGYSSMKKLDFYGTEEDEADDEDVIPAELLEDVQVLNRSEYSVNEMIQETFQDLDQMIQFLQEARRFDPKNDDKLKKLVQLLKSKDLKDEKVLIFTEFADTARYIRRQLQVAGIGGVEQIDSATKASRKDVIERFAPYYNQLSSGELKESDRKEIRILIATDVLSEGLNLQDATRMINYDIHWNPVRLMQRIGRVDRRLSPHVEQRLIADHPHLKGQRGNVWFWNFLPPEELNAILTLYTKVTHKTLLISKTLGIEGKKLFKPEDEYEALKDFNHAYEGTRTALEDMHLQYQSMIQTDPELEHKLMKLPGGIFSGKKLQSAGVRGVFLCYSLPAFDKSKEEFTHDAGSTRWYLYDVVRETVMEDPTSIDRFVKSSHDTQRHCEMSSELLVSAKAAVEKHIKNTYLRRVDAPVGVKPALKCWMELNEG